MKVTAKPKKAPTTKSLADFRAIHDSAVVVPAKIEAALAAMLAESEEQWDYEQDFMRRAGVSSTQISMFRDNYADYIVEARPIGSGKSAKRVWFASKKVAAKARETL